MEFKVYNLLALFFVLGTVLSQVSNHLDIDDIQKQIKNNGGPDISDLEQKLQENGVTLPEFSNTKLDMEKVEKIFKEKCEKQGVENAVDSLKDQQESLKNCLTNQINGTQIQEELEVAKETGSMDEVFAKYCKKWPDIYGCVENVTVTVRSCMTEKEQKAFNKSLDIMKDLQEFMCFKDGDRLAMFVAEGGVECVQEQQQGITDCLNSTLSGRFPEPTEFSVATLPSFLFTEDDCHDFDKVRQCVNVVLEKCKDTTPANIVDAFFKFLKKQMPCGNQGENTAVKTAAATSEKEANSAYSFASSILVTLGMLMLVRIY